MTGHGNTLRDSGVVPLRTTDARAHISTPWQRRARLPPVVGNRPGSLTGRCTYTMPGLVHGAYFGGPLDRPRIGRTASLTAAQMEAVMDDLAVERIGVIANAPGAVIQDLFATLAERLVPRLRVAGVVAENHGLADRRCSAGYLRRVGNGQRFAMFEDAGPGSTTCHLDGSGVARAAEAVTQDLLAGCDLVLLSKFGKLEAAGEGLWRAFAAVADAQVPLLTSVSPSVATAWSSFAGTKFVTLPADHSAIDTWLHAVQPGLRSC